MPRFILVPTSTPGRCDGCAFSTHAYAHLCCYHPYTKCVNSKYSNTEEERHLRYHIYKQAVLSKNIKVL